MIDPNGNYDVVVIGGGPGGSASAGLLAQRGHRVLLLEREKHPRYQIGESMITGALPTVEALGLSERLDRMGFVKKYGGTLLWGSGNPPSQSHRQSEPVAGGPGAGTWGFRFREASRFEYSYQVRRADFDALLLTRARELGAHVIEEATVHEPVLDGDRVAGLTYSLRGESRKRTVSSRMVVDASGQSHVLARHFDLVEWHEDLRNIAVWTYLQGCRRYTGDHAGDILTENRPDGWFWFIPMLDGTVSVGYVTPIDAYKRSGLALEELFASELAASQEVGALTEGAIRASGFRTIRDWSYTCTRFQGPGWALVGDAAAFVDPLLSTGVTLAMRGAAGLAEAVDAALREPEAEAALLERYEKNYREFLDSLLDFVRFFYNRSFRKEDYWDKAQESIDPEKVRTRREDFATILSGLTGMRDIFDSPGA